MSRKNTVVLIFVAILAFVSGFAAKEAASLINFDSKEVAKAKEMVRERLKDPDSAIFEDVVENSHMKGVVCGSYNAKNSYGGYGGKTKFIMSTIWDANGSEIEIYDSKSDEEQKKLFLTAGFHFAHKSTYLFINASMNNKPAQRVCFL